MSDNAAPGAILVIESGSDNPVGLLGQWLRDTGATLDVRSGPAGELPADLSGYGGLVVMGGSMGAQDDAIAAWLPDTRRLLSEAARAQLPTLGVCLGAQLLAAAVGGRVEVAAAPVIGAQLIAKRQAAANDVLFAELPITPDVLQWHFDEITRLPAAAVLLASSPATEVEAFRIGGRAWGIQFHIETTPELVQDWAAEDIDRIKPFYDVPAILERARAVHPDLAEVWAPFAAAFARIVADPELAPVSRTLPMAGGQTVTAAPITDPAEIRAALAAEMNAARGHPH
ncbi:MAG: guaA [Frankiales bacterium]|nr:guaA [Frankiales bacterium]